MTRISELLRGMNENNFQKLLLNFGIKKFDFVGKSVIVIYSTERNRAGRIELLQRLAQVLFPKYKTEYKKEATYSSVGYVLVPSTKAKIVLKPLRTGGNIILKPKFFDTGSVRLTDVKIPHSIYYRKLLDAVEANKKLDSLQKAILINLIEDSYKNNIHTTQSVRNSMKQLLEILDISTINNDFGELLGPLSIESRKLLPIKFQSAKVFIPGRSNEPLLDYKIEDSSKEYKISAKSGGTTNTLKPGDVVKLIEADSKLRRKWKGKIEFDILEILNDNGWRQGPIEACFYLKKKGLYKDEVGWMQDSQYTEETRQECENILVKLSREKIDFTPIFVDATTAQIYYVNFRLDPSGKITWKLVETTDKDQKNIKRIKFRSKNFIGRPNGEKLGFQT